MCDKKIAASLLESDFNQCFEQMRYYDAQIVGIFKFLATFYTTISGVSIGLYKYSLTIGIDLSAYIAISLCIALVFGLAMYFLIVRNRVYFVCCARYINEQRDVFLSVKPLGFENKVGMYVDCNAPAFFNWKSSQALWMYIVAVTNSIFAGAILFFNTLGIWIIMIGGISVVAVQLIIGIIYLSTRENKKISKAVFGK